MEGGGVGWGTFIFLKHLRLGFAFSVVAVPGLGSSVVGVLSMHTVAELCPRLTCHLFKTVFNCVYVCTSVPVHACGGQKKMLNVHSLCSFSFFLILGVVLFWLCWTPASCSDPPFCSLCSWGLRCAQVSSLLSVCYDPNSAPDVCTAESIDCEAISLAVCCFWDRVSFYSPSWPWSCVDLSVVEAWMLGLQYELPYTWLWSLIFFFSF